MKGLLLLVTLSILFSCQKEEKTHHSHYSFEIKLKPSQQYLSTNLHLYYVHPFEQSDTLSFLLHKNLIVESVKSKEIDHFIFDTVGTSLYRYTPSAGVLKIKLKKAISKNESFDLNIKYSGSIGDVNYWKTNRLTEEWVELGNYTPWFPYNPDLDNISFEIKCIINSDYKIESNGETKKTNDNWIIENSTTNNDIILLASKNLKSKEILGTNYKLKVSTAAPLSKSTIDSMLKLGGKTLNNFNEWFGSIELSFPKIIITPREKGGGYARRGIIILSKINDEDFLNSKNRYIQYFAHELSHFWWTNAPTDSWEDWLNESFAEYSALLSLRDLVGESEFNGMIQKKSTNFNELPPVRGIDRDDEKAYDVLYNKGCYILYTLEKDIGTEKFMELIREVYLNKISCTEDLINLITKKFGTEVAQRFNSQLDV